MNSNTHNLLHLQHIYVYNTVYTYRCTGEQMFLIVWIEEDIWKDIWNINSGKTR